MSQAAAIVAPLETLIAGAQRRCRRIPGIALREHHALASSARAADEYLCPALGRNTAIGSPWRWCTSVRGPYTRYPHARPDRHRTRLSRPDDRHPWSRLRSLVEGRVGNDPVLRPMAPAAAPSLPPPPGTIIGRSTRSAGAVRTVSRTPSIDAGVRRRGPAHYTVIRLRRCPRHRPCSVPSPSRTVPWQGPYSSPRREPPHRRRRDRRGPTPAANASTAAQANVDGSLILIARSHMRYCRA